MTKYYIGGKCPMCSCRLVGMVNTKIYAVCKNCGWNNERS